MNAPGARKEKGRINIIRNDYPPEHAKYQLFVFGVS